MHLAYHQMLHVWWGKSYLGKQHQFAFWEKFQQEDCVGLDKFWTY